MTKQMRKIDADDAIRFLNELVGIDRIAIGALIDHRVVCNEQLGEHPTVQVGGADTTYLVGMLGIFNGLFGIRDDGYGYITAIFDDGILMGFRKTALEPE